MAYISNNDNLVLNYNGSGCVNLYANGSVSANFINGSYIEARIREYGLLDLCRGGGVFVSDSNTGKANEGTARTLCRLRDNETTTSSTFEYDFGIGGISNTLLIGTTGSTDYLILRGKNYKLGSSSGTTITSDKRLKKDFSELDKYESFYMDLKPLSFKYKYGTSGRDHMGFIAQEVEASLENNGLSTKEFGGIIKSEHGIEKDDVTGELSDYEKHFEEAGIHGGDIEYGLIYSEFIALNTHMIQKLYARIADLEAEVAELKQK